MSRDDDALLEQPASAQQQEPLQESGEMDKLEAPASNNIERSAYGDKDGEHTDDSKSPVDSRLAPDITNNTIALSNPINKSSTSSHNLPALAPPVSQDVSTEKQDRVDERKPTEETIMTNAERLVFDIMFANLIWDAIDSAVRQRSNNTGDKPSSKPERQKAVTITETGNNESSNLISKSDILNRSFEGISTLAPDSPAMSPRPSATMPPSTVLGAGTPSNPNSPLLNRPGSASRNANPRLSNVMRNQRLSSPGQVASLDRSRERSDSARSIQSKLLVETSVSAYTESRSSSVDLAGHIRRASSIDAITSRLSSAGGEGKSSRRRKNQEDDTVLVGTKISEGHANYVLMYDMLTGIRNAVSRCVAKPYRPLEKPDFKARHKLTFDIMGNELTPSSRYDFKFKDYAPWVFRYIREHFKIEAADYLVSLTAKYVLSELGSPGKSGSFFYFSQDYRFIIKTIHHTEHKFLCKILERYYEHIQNNPNTLLSRYYGLHRVKLTQGRKIHFVVMGNVFPPNKDMHEVFDLKGSMVGREVSEEEISANPRVVRKDLNWLKENRRLHLGPEKARLLEEQMERDVRFLMEMNIMDYSLLTGVHFISRGNSENIRDKSLSVFEPDATSLSKQPVSSKKSSHASNLRRVIANSDPVQLGPNSLQLPEETPLERKGSIFTQDDGGYLSTSETNTDLQKELYFIGIIDILTPYNVVKKAEHAFKSLSMDANLISAVNPHKYVIGWPDPNKPEPLSSLADGNKDRKTMKPLAPIAEDGADLEMIPVITPTSTEQP